MALYTGLIHSSSTRDSIHTARPVHVGLCLHGNAPSTQHNLSTWGFVYTARLHPHGGPIASGPRPSALRRLRLGPVDRPSFCEFTRGRVEQPRTPGLERVGEPTSRARHDGSRVLLSRRRRQKQGPAIPSAGGSGAALPLHSGRKMLTVPPCWGDPSGSLCTDPQWTARPGAQPSGSL